jgi:predicted ATPase
MLDEFPGGVWLVELAPLIDAALVPAAVASAIGVPLSSVDDTVEVVGRFLAARRALLVLDNCEHVVAVAAALVDRLLSASPRLRILATSREPLGVAGESVWRVPSLPVDAGPGEVGDAVALFAERAARVRPAFEDDDETRATVVQVCRRLDGTPLAIELAAARAKVMSVEQIAARLDERFRLLTRGGRTAVARQQTLQGAIDWSYELLTTDERDLFDLLAVFAGDFDLAAAAAVSERDEFEVLDMLDQLVDKSMLEADPSRDRYRLLETMRQYGWERLASAGRLPRARDAHAEHFAALAAEQAALGRAPGRQVETLDRLDADYDNLRTGLAYLIEEHQAQRAARMVRWLIGLLNIRHPREGLGWFQQVVAISDGLPGPSRSRLLADAAFAAFNAGNHEAQGQYANSAIEVGGEDAPAIAYAQLSNWYVANGDIELAVESGRRGVAAANDLTARIVAYHPLLIALGAQGAEPEIRADIPVLLDLAESLGSPTLRASSYVAAGQAFDRIGHLDEALAMFRAALTDTDGAGARIQAPARLYCAVATDDHDEAADLLRTAIPVVREQLSGEPRTYAFVPTAKYAFSVGASVEAARLIGAYQRHLREQGGAGEPIMTRGCQRVLDQLRGAVSAYTLDQELANGARLSIDAALRLAWDVVSPDGQLS